MSHKRGQPLKTSLARDCCMMTLNMQLSHLIVALMAGTLSKGMAPRPDDSMASNGCSGTLCKPFANLIRIR